MTRRTRGPLHGLMRCRSILAITAVLAVLQSPMTAEQARRRAIGGVGITVFEDANFRGRSATFRSDTPDLVRFGLNDRISSLRVAPGERWEACEHVNYRGRCQVFSGSEANLVRAGWNDTISSLRRVRGGVGIRPPTPGPGPRGRLVLYDDRRFRGRSVTVTSPVATLSGFNNRAESARVSGDGVWELCDQARFRGRCVTVSSDVADLGSLRNRVASARPRPR